MVQLPMNQMIHLLGWTILFCNFERPFVSLDCEIICIAKEEWDDQACEVSKPTLTENYRIEELGYGDLQNRIYNMTIGCRQCR